MLMSEYNRQYCRDYPKEVLYAGEFLEHLGMVFAKDFGNGNAVDIAANQFIMYLEFLNEGNMRGY